MSVRPILKRGRPVATAPLDQRVTVTVTLKERVLADIEAKKIEGGGSLAELVRNRTDSSIDIAAWKDAAIVALSKLQEDESRKRELRSMIDKKNREKERALMRQEVEKIPAIEEEKQALTQEYTSLGKDTQKRSARLIGRVSLADRERIIWRASKLNLTVSDFVRIMVFDLLPGENDRHMSSMSRKKFYEAVLIIARDGWGEEPKVTHDSCPHCHKPLR